MYMRLDEEYPHYIIAVVRSSMFSTAAQDHIDSLRGMETPPRGVCLGGGRKASWCQCPFIPSCVHASAHCCYIRMLHRSCCSCAPIGSDCVCNLPLQLLSNRNETILILASAAVGNFLLPVSASRQVCVCVCACVCAGLLVVNILCTYIHACIGTYKS